MALVLNDGRFVSRTGGPQLNPTTDPNPPMKSMTSVITKSALVLAAFAGMNAFAGTPAKAPAPAPAPASSGALFDTLGASASVGYDTRYYWRGLSRADNTVSSGLNLDLPLSEQLSLGVGANYIHSVENNTATGEAGSDNEYSELNLTTGLTYDLGGAKIGVNYTNYQYFDGFSAGAVSGGDFDVSSANEVGTTLSTSLGGLNLSAGWYYNFTVGGSYAQIGADFPIEVTSFLSLVPAVQMGYGWDYFADPTVGRTGGLTHILPSISAPIKLTDSATLTPYVAYNISLDSRHAFNGEDADIFGGVRLSVSF